VQFYLRVRRYGSWLCSYGMYESNMFVRLDTLVSFF
jgi:hypothetical protein